MEIDGNPMDDSESKTTDDIDGKPLLDEPPPPGTEPQRPLPNEVPPPLPPETYSDCESNASNPEEVSPEPPDDNMNNEQNFQAEEQNSIVSGPVIKAVPEDEPSPSETTPDTLQEDSQPVPIPDSTSHTSIPEEAASLTHVKEKKKKKDKVCILIDY